MSFISKQIAKLLLNLINGILDSFGDYINNIFGNVVLMNDNSMVSSVVLFVTSFSIVLLIFYAAKTMFSAYVIEDTDTDPLDYLVRVAMAVAVIGCNGEIFNIFMDLSTAVWSDVNGAVDGSLFAVSDSLNSLEDVGSGLLLVFAFMILAILIGLILFTITAGIRGAELVLFKTLLPIFAIDLVTDGKERWAALFSSYMITFFGYVIQLFSFRMFCGSFSQVQVGGLSTALITTFGWLVIMIRAPKWLQKYTYTSGTGKKATGAAARGTNAILRRFIR